MNAGFVLKQRRVGPAGVGQKIAHDNRLPRSFQRQYLFVFGDKFQASINSRLVKEQ